MHVLCVLTTLPGAWVARRVGSGRHEGSDADKGQTGNLTLFIPGVRISKPPGHLGKLVQDVEGVRAVGCVEGWCEGPMLNLQLEKSFRG